MRAPYNKMFTAFVLTLVVFNPEAISADVLSSSSAYDASYFGAYGVVRATLASDDVLIGVIQVNPGSPAQGDKTRTVMGTVVVKGLLYGKTDAIPRRIPFERETDFGSSFVESAATAPFYGWSSGPMDKVQVVVFLRRGEKAWELLKAVPINGQNGAKLVHELRLLQSRNIRIDNPNALSKPFDAQLTPLAEAVRLGLLRMIQDTSR